MSTIIRKLRLVADSFYAEDPDIDPDDQWSRGGENLILPKYLLISHKSDEEGGFYFERVTDEESQRIDADIRREEKSKYYEERPVFEIDWEIEPGKVYMVMAIFCEGDSFGSSTGNIEVEAVFKTIEEADDWLRENKSKIEEKHNDYFGGIENIEIVSIPLVRRDGTQTDRK